MPPHEEGIGYGRLASTLALDNDLCIFRHFAELNIRNILYLQSELQELELKLQQLDVEANENTNEPSKWSKPRSYHYASRTETTGSDGIHAYWDTVLRIRDVLERYSTFSLSRSGMRWTPYSISVQDVDHVVSAEIKKVKKYCQISTCLWKRKLKTDLALHLDKALRNEAWLQKLKTPSKTSWSAVHEFVAANKTLISEADAQYTSAEHLDDLVHLTWNEKEAMSVLIEKHLKRFFKKRVRTKRLG